MPPRGRLTSTIGTTTATNCARIAGTGTTAVTGAAPASTTAGYPTPPRLLPSPTLTTTWSFMTVLSLWHCAAFRSLAMAVMMASGSTWRAPPRRSPTLTRGDNRDADRRYSSELQDGGNKGNFGKGKFYKSSPTKVWFRQQEVRTLSAIMRRIPSIA